MRKLVLLLFGYIIVLPCVAREFSYAYEGHILTYTVLDEDAKTCEVKAGYFDSALRDYVSCNVVAGDLIIPSLAIDKDNSYKVVAVGRYCFFSCTELRSVVVPETVKDLGENAFCYCYGLMSVHLPDCLTEIKRSLFLECISLESITIPEHVSIIEDFAFSRCMSLK